MRDPTATVLTLKTLRLLRAARPVPDHQRRRLEHVDVLFDVGLTGNLNDGTSPSGT